MKMEYEVISDVDEGVELASAMQAEINRRAKDRWEPISTSVATTERAGQLMYRWVIIFRKKLKGTL